MTPPRIALVGGGLANALIACRLAATNPDLALLVIEPREIGGNHTWCFHAGDLTPAQRSWMAPFVTRQWDGYDVRFARRTRRLALPYCCVTAERLRDIVRSFPQITIVGEPAVTLGAHAVELRSGRIVEADLVLDGRGGDSRGDWELAWQVFVGLQVRLAAPHGLAAPVIMDARVPQGDAFRFMYCLPFSDTELLIEDTRYQNGRRFDPAVLRSEIHAYADGRGWRIESLVREEQGALPLVLSGRSPTPENDAVPVGMRAGLFHPLTGYSLPDAVRLADGIAALPTLTTETLRPFVETVVAEHWRRHAFTRLLNRLLFLAGEPGERDRIMSRFYSLREPLIGRVYAGRPSVRDMARILAGRPPVSLLGAIASLLPSSARGFTRQAERA